VLVASFESRTSQVLALRGTLQQVWVVLIGRLLDLKVVVPACAFPREFCGGPLGAKVSKGTRTFWKINSLHARW